MFHYELSLHVLHTQWLLHIEKEIHKMCIFHFSSILVSSVFCPILSKGFQILLKNLQHVFLWKVVKIKLLQNNKYEQIEHHYRAYKIKAYKEDRGVPFTTILALNTPWLFSHVVKHEPVPVLAG